MSTLEFRNRVQHTRKLLRWSQYDLAKASKVCRTTLALFERGHIELNLMQRARVESALALGFADRRAELEQAAGEVCGNEKQRPDVPNL